MALQAITLVILTLSEYIGLLLWLKFADEGNHLIAFAVLVLGLFIERMIVFVNLIRRANDPVSLPVSHASQRFGIQAVREGLMWVVWLVLADRIGILFPTLLLFLTMLYEHSADVAQQNGKHSLYYAQSPVALFYTVVEVAGAGLWLHFVRTGQPTLGAIILLVTFVIEHVMQGRIVDLNGPGGRRAAPAA